MSDTIIHSSQSLPTKVPLKVRHLSKPSLDLSLEIPSLMLWVKEEPFLLGIVSPTPCAKMSIKMIRRVSDYCKGKADYYPKMTLGSWGHISKYKLQVSIELAWTYFRIFDVLVRKLESHSNFKEKDAYDIKMEKLRRCVETTHDVKMDTLNFILFLFIQNFGRLHNRFNCKSQQSFDETWPVYNSDDLGTDSKRKSNKIKRKPVPEQGHLEFVIANLTDIIACLVLATKKKKKHRLTKEYEENSFEIHNRLPLNIVNCLSLIIGAANIKGNPKDTEFSTLEQCITALPEAARAVDLNKSNGTVDKHRFILWVKSNLKFNPWGPSSAPVPQKTVDCRTGIWQKTRAYECNRIYWNTQIYPKGWYLISTVNNQVLYLDSVKPLSSLKIHRCSDSYIYVPGVFSSVLIEKCHNSTIFLGPAAKVVKFVDCSNLQVSAVSRAFILQDVVKSNFNILTPSAPIICGGKGKKIVFGPYNTFYPQLGFDMDSVGLGIVIQKWNKPIEFDSHGVVVENSHIQSGSHTPSYLIMRSNNFSNLIFPFKMEGLTSRNPCELPRNYEIKVMKMESNSHAFKCKVKESNLSEEKIEQLKEITLARFHNWLKEQGHLDQLKGLKSIQKSFQMDSSIPILETRKSIKKELLEIKKKSNEELHNETKTNYSPKKIKKDERKGRPAQKRTSRVATRHQEEIKNEDIFNNQEVTDSIYFMGSDEDDEYADGESSGDETNSGRKEKGDCSRKTIFQNMLIDDGLLWNPII